MKGNKRKSKVSVIQNSLSQDRDEYTVLVPVQNSKQFDLLLSPAIDLAKKNQGYVLLLNIIEIPYQLPPSSARKFILERELLLSQGLEILEGAECRGNTAVRIAHDKNDAVRQFSKDEDVNVVIQEYDLKTNSDTIFNRMRKKIKSWF